MKKLLLPFAAVVLMFLLSISAFAHPGRTDSQGGHRDSSTGTYHYHHGYSAHQHPNGVCPYDFDDKTNTSPSSSGSSNKTTASNSSKNSSPKKETTSTIKEEPKTSIFKNPDFWIAFALYILPWIIVLSYPLIILPVVEKIKDWRNK